MINTGCASSEELFFFQAEDGIRDYKVTGVQTCALPILRGYLRVFEMHGDGLIAPRILQLVASIGDVKKRHAQLVRGILKTSRLVTEFSGKEQQSFERIRHL